MTKVIGVRFRTGSRVYYFDPAELAVQTGDGVIVETARGLEFGEAVQGVTDVEESAVVAPLKPVVRIATETDVRMRNENAAKEQDAFAVCEKKIAEHGLDMKLVDVEYTFNGSKVVFYFTADERVDFRELVKDLASQFRTRIELRQIGVRDEAKMLGGLGSCGRPVCCKTFLDDFKPVSIKMAKEQNLSLSPTKISGLCGRLMCCLQYEQSAYEEMKKKMPRTGKEVQTPDGVGIAIENNAVTEKTRVKLMMQDGTLEVREYHYSLLNKPGDTPIAAPTPKPAPSLKPMANAAYVPPEPPADAPVAQTQEVRKRRRRGGHGRGQGEGRIETAAAEKQPQNSRPPRQQPKQQDAAPAGQGASGQGAENAKKPYRRRHRRGGNGPRPTPPEA